MVLVGERALHLTARGEAYLSRRCCLNFGAGFPWVTAAIKGGKASARIVADRVVFRDELAEQEFSLPVDRRGFLRDQYGKEVINVAAPPEGSGAALYIPFWKYFLGAVPQGLAGKSELFSPQEFREKLAIYLSMEPRMRRSPFPFFLQLSAHGLANGVLSLPVWDGEVPLFLPETERRSAVKFAVALEWGYLSPRMVVYSVSPSPGFAGGAYLDNDRKAAFTLDPRAPEYGLKSYFVKLNERNEAHLAGLAPFHFTPKTRAGSVWRIQVGTDGNPRRVMLATKRYSLPLSPVTDSGGNILHFQVGRERAAEAQHQRGTGFTASVYTNHDSLALALPKRGGKMRSLFLPQDCGIKAGETVFVETEQGHAVRVHSLEAPDRPAIPLMVIRNSAGKIRYSSYRRIPETYLRGHCRLENVVSFQKQSNGRFYEHLRIAEKDWMVRRIKEPAAFRPSLYAVELYDRTLLSAVSEDEATRLLPIIARDAFTGGSQTSAPANATNLNAGKFILLEQVPVEEEKGQWFAWLKGRKILLPDAALKMRTRRVSILGSRIFNSPRINKIGESWPAEYFRTLLELDFARACGYLCLTKNSPKLARLAQQHGTTLLGAQLNETAEKRIRLVIHRLEKCFNLRPVQKETSPRREPPRYLTEAEFPEDGEMADSDDPLLTFARQARREKP